MKNAKNILKITDTLLTAFVLFILLIVVLYSLYALWDNNQIYAKAENIQIEMKELKPDVNKPSFQDLLLINEDIVGWITLDGTKIDYPIVQGENNLSYINTDVYRNFSLAGSIFLDSRNSSKFNETYSLLYGHHIDGGRMFGDLVSYKEESFFNNNQTGTLITLNETYNLEVYATLVVDSTDKRIFSPLSWNDNLDELLDFVENNALYMNQDVIDKMKRDADRKSKTLALTTCSYEFTDARTVVLAYMDLDSTTE